MPYRSCKPHWQVSIVGLYLPESLWQYEYLLYFLILYNTLFSHSAGRLIPWPNNLILGFSRFLWILEWKLVFVRNHKLIGRVWHCYHKSSLSRNPRYWIVKYCY